MDLLELKKSILLDINDSIRSVKTPSEYFTMSFVEKYFPSLVNEQRINNGFDSITKQKIQEAGKIASKIIRNGISSFEDAEKIEAILEYGKMNGYERIVKSAGFLSKYAIYSDVQGRDPFKFLSL